MKIYVPSDYTNKPCISIQDKDTIRVYDNSPSINTTSTYTDLFINSHYISKVGSQTWGQYNQNLPSCVVSSSITDNVFYRNDISDILVTFFILLLVCFYFPYKIISRLFGRWLKL